MALSAGLGKVAAAAEFLRNHFYNFSIHSIYISITIYFQDKTGDLWAHCEYPVPAGAVQYRGGETTSWRRFFQWK